MFARKLTPGAVVLAVAVTCGAGTAVAQEMKLEGLTELKRADLTGAEGIEVIHGIVEVPPGKTVPRHTHSGDEFIYVLQGAMVQPPGQEPRMLETGEVSYAPRDTPHGGMTVVGDTSFKFVSVFILDKGKPFMAGVK